MRQVQFLSFIFQNPLSTKSGNSVMMYCNIKINVIMMLFVTCCFAYVIEKYDINKDREHEKLYSIHFSGRGLSHCSVSYEEEL